MQFSPVSTLYWCAPGAHLLQFSPVSIVRLPIHVTTHQQFEDSHESDVDSSEVLN